MRIAAFDIETTGLNATFGHILCTSFCEIDTAKRRWMQPYTLRLDSPDYFTGDPIDDSRLVGAVIQELGKYNLLLSWNGKRFDLRMLNSRALKYRLPPTHRYVQWHLDLMQHYKLHSRAGWSLDKASRFLHTTESKTELDPDIWARAGLLHTDAMDLVVEHCEADVATLCEVYWHILPMIKNVTR